MRLAKTLPVLAAALLAACSTSQKPAAVTPPPAPDAKAVAAAPAAAPAAAAPAVASLTDGKMAKVCATCHAAPKAGTIRGHLDEVAFKASSFQMKVDGSTEVVTFGPDLKVVNGPEGADLEKVLKATKKGAESLAEFTVVGGVRKVTTLTLKPKLKVPEEKQIKTAELEKLVAQGPAKGKYFLYDARPAPRFAEGFIPTAENLPFPSFEKDKGKLPADKSALVIFYCAGVTCAMSPAARDAAEKLGYVNAKSYHEGIPVWSKANPMALTPKLLQEAWFAKEQPIVVLDARQDTAGGIIGGAAALADTAQASLAKVTALKKLRPPVVVYDADGAGNSVAVARALVAAGQPAMVLQGGLAAWKGAGYALADAKPATQVAFTPKPKPGEISLENFKKLVAAPSPDALIVDVRNADEVADGAFAGSINVPATQLANRVAELPKDKLLVCHCSTGVRAELAYNVLKGAGFTKVAFLNAPVEFFGGKATIGED
jgi:rhodanese-related sulfurtransferase